MKITIASVHQGGALRSGNAGAFGPNILAAVILLLTTALRADDKPRPPNETKTLIWYATLTEGRRHALIDHKPLLVRVGASWCPPCRKLDAELEKPSVQAELGRWTLVYLDADKAEEEAKELNVAGLPALRVRTMLGETVAAREGFLSADDLVSWLKRQYELAAAEADEVLLTNDEPDAAGVVRLVRLFQQRDPVIREAAIRRLAACPQNCRFHVVEVFVEGSLSRRLAALELLRAWRAPVAELDPWQPETFSKERIATLHLWAEKYRPLPEAEVKKLSERSLADARRDIDRMMKSSASDAAAMRDRLAACGPALLPEVAARLQQAAGDEQRQRLWALRYRVVAADSLVLRWPGGLERLAAIDARARQQAADELARLAAAADQPLLVELFSDSDPLVRELSLRGLQNIGGRPATAALVKLLADPEPNVRAAVLKQLEEKPDATIIPKLADYLKTEKDPDLLVHAVRFLRAAGGAKAVQLLIPMLKHESWQVRAEACEALGKTNVDRSVSYVNGVRVDDGEKLQVEIYAALIELLSDSDAFVISRAVEGLHSVDMVLAVEPLVRAAATHPDLAPAIVAMLSQGQKMRPAAVPHLRKFRTHENAQVRAAAMKGICDALPSEIGEQLARGLSDPAEKVRIAAAAICLEKMEQQRSNRVQQMQQQPGVASSFAVFENRDTVVYSHSVKVSTSPTLLGYLATALEKTLGGEVKPPVTATVTPATIAAVKSAAESKPAEEKRPPAREEKSPDPYDTWLTDYYAGKIRPKWSEALIAPLETMLKAKNVDEQLAAGMALVPMGRAQAVLPQLYVLANGDEKKFYAVSQVLPWLVWKDREAAFRQLRKLAGAADHFRYLIYSMEKVRDRRACELFWDLLADPKVNAESAGQIARGMLEMYGFERWYGSGSDRDLAMKRAMKNLAATLKPRAESGNELQRLVALALWTYCDKEAAAQLAEKMQADAKLSPALRADFFQAALALASQKEGARRAAAALADKDRDRQKMALRYLVRGPNSLSELRRSIEMRVESISDSIRSGQPIVPQPPAGLKPSQLLPLVDDADAAVAAEAGYLLTLLGDSRGLPPLVRYYRNQDKDDQQTQRLVYRAIAALDDSSQIPLLKKIYSGMERYYVSEFYWTIRVMTGPEILKFRKQIRDEVGMDQLQ